MHFLFPVDDGKDLLQHVLMRVFEKGLREPRLLEIPAPSMLAPCQNSVAWKDRS
jgi:hypothetical protein